LDFVDWCGRVLTAMAEVMNASPQARSMGTRDLEIAAVIFGQDAVFGPSGFHGSERHGAVNDALSELHQLGVVEEPSQSFWRLGQAGERAVADQVAGLGSLRSSLRTSVDSYSRWSTVSASTTRTTAPRRTG